MNVKQHIQHLSDDDEQQRCGHGNIIYYLDHVQVSSAKIKHLEFWHVNFYYPAIYIFSLGN
jgi:hypothetical protein